MLELKEAIWDLLRWLGIELCSSRVISTTLGKKHMSIVI